MYPGFHLLSSANWDDSNWQTVSALGELRSAVRSFDDGSEPAVVPSAVVVGSESCIRSGEALGQGLPASSLVNGFPAGCFLPPAAPSTTWSAASAVDSCAIQFMCARLIEWLYDANETAIADFLSGFLGPAWSLTYHARAGVVPAVFTARSSGGFLCWIEGTANFQQLALQATYAQEAPANFGVLSTSPFWYAASEAVRAYCEADGLNGSMPFFAAGHSYGAVLAELLAARLRAASSTRRIRWIGYGSPKPGDSRLNDLLFQTEGILLANDSDIITVVPPDALLMLPLIVLIGPALFGRWTAWRQAPFRFTMDDQGALTPNGIPLMDTVTLAALVTDIFGGVQFPNVLGHTITLYAERIVTRCNAAEWPIDPVDYDKLKEVGVILMEGTGDVLEEDSSQILLEW